MLILRRLYGSFQDLDATVLQDPNAQPMHSLQYGTTALMLNFEGFVACIRCRAVFVMIDTYTQIPVRYSLLLGSAVKVIAAFMNGTLSWRSRSCSPAE